MLLYAYVCVRVEGNNTLQDLKNMYFETLVYDPFNEHIF
jgi:hypothetical protein